MQDKHILTALWKLALKTFGFPYQNPSLFLYKVAPYPVVLQVIEAHRSKHLKVTTAFTYKVNTSWCVRVLNTFNSQTFASLSVLLVVWLPWKGWPCSRMSDTPRSLWFGVAGACVCLQDSQYNAGVPAVVTEETGLSDRGLFLCFSLFWLWISQFSFSISFWIQSGLSMVMPLSALLSPPMKVNTEISYSSFIWAFFQCILKLKLLFWDRDRAWDSSLSHWVRFCKVWWANLSACCCQKGQDHTGKGRQGSQPSLSG